MKHKNFLFVSLLLVAILFQFACQCNRVDCANGDSAILEFRVSNDGELLDLADLEAEIVISSYEESAVPFTIVNNQISAWLDHEELYTIQLGEVAIIELIGTIEMIDRGQCCDIFGFTNILVEGLVACEESCSGFTILL